MASVGQHRARIFSVSSGTAVVGLAFAVAFVLTIAVPQPVQAQTFKVIHTFTGGGGDGANPNAGVTYRAGILYGTTANGGTGGVVYQLVHSGDNWIYSPISLLSSGEALPLARVVFGPDGHPYGTTYLGGHSGGEGTVFDLIVPLTICRTVFCPWKENVLYEFMGGPDGNRPAYGDLTWDQQDNIYGTTFNGGLPTDGTVFEMTKSGNTWAEKSIYTFSGRDGASPQNAVIFDNNGNLFGTTLQGGLYGFGTVFELTYQMGVWTETVLHSFQNSNDGYWPQAGLVFDGTNFYGAASGGGSGPGGTVFELSPSGNTWTFTVLYSFSGTGCQKCGPAATLTMDTVGNLYGTTFSDGAYNKGNVFKLTKTADSYAYSSLYDFTGGDDGANPIGQVTIDPSDGVTLYGTANNGGNSRCAPYGCGVVWMIKP